MLNLRNTIKRAATTTLLALLTAGAFAQTATINAILTANATHLSPEPGVVADGAPIAIYFSSPVFEPAHWNDPNTSMPRDLGGISVNLTSPEGTTYDLNLIDVRPGQITGTLPFINKQTTLDARIQGPGWDSGPHTMTITDQRPEISTYGLSTKHPLTPYDNHGLEAGLAAAIIYNRDGTPAGITGIQGETNGLPLTPAKPDQFIQVWVAGLGAPEQPLDASLVAPGNIPIRRPFIKIDNKEYTEQADLERIITYSGTSSGTIVGAGVLNIDLAQLNPTGSFDIQLSGDGTNWSSPGTIPIRTSDDWTAGRVENPETYNPVPSTITLTNLSTNEQTSTHTTATGWYTINLPTGLDTDKILIHADPDSEKTYDYATIKTRAEIEKDTRIHTIDRKSDSTTSYYYPEFSTTNKYGMEWVFRDGTPATHLEQIQAPVFTIADGWGAISRPTYPVRYNITHPEEFTPEQRTLFEQAVATALATPNYPTPAYIPATPENEHLGTTTLSIGAFPRSETNPDAPARGGRESYTPNGAQKKETVTVTIGIDTLKDGLAQAATGNTPDGLYQKVLSTIEHEARGHGGGYDNHTEDHNSIMYPNNTVANMDDYKHKGPAYQEFLGIMESLTYLPHGFQTRNLFEPDATHEQILNGARELYDLHHPPEAPTTEATTGPQAFVPGTAWVMRSDAIS